MESNVNLVNSAPCQPHYNISDAKNKIQRKSEVETLWRTSHNDGTITIQFTAALTATLICETSKTGITPRFPRLQTIYSPGLV